MTFTKEEQIQAVYDLKVGYTLGHADIAILKGLARMALAGMEAVPVAWLWSNRKHPSEVTLVRPEDDERAEAAQWSGWSCQALYSTPQSATVLPEMLPFPVMFQPGWRFGKGVRTQTMLDALQRRAEYYTELEAMTPEQRADHDAGVKGFAAMLPANHSVDANEKDKAEPVSNRDELPVTQFKPVADLYGITSPTGSETIFTFDAVEARDFIDGGWSCQEYVELERYQAAMTNQSEQVLDMVNSPVIPDGWVDCSERLPDETNDPDGGATCYLVLYAEGRQPNGGSNVQVSNVTYLRRWHDGMITHWMPLPAAPQQESE